jgi:hypothetical protein
MNEACFTKLSVVSFYACHHMLSQYPFRGHFSLVTYLLQILEGCYPRAIAFSSWSLSEAAFDVLLLNRRSMIPVRFPSGLLDQTLDRRLVPSAFNRTGYITSEGLPERQEVTSVIYSHPITAPRRTPTNIPRTTNAITLLPLNSNPTVLGPVT